MPKLNQTQPQKIDPNSKEGLEAINQQHRRKIQEIRAIIATGQADIRQLEIEMGYNQGRIDEMGRQKEDKR